jgi:orotate phosphoribosyltransferase
VNQTEVLDVLKRTGALMEGHFKLSSGRHSDTYVQKQMVFQHPRLTASLGEALAERFEAERFEAEQFMKGGHAFDTVLSPAVGAILFGNAVAYAAGGRFVYAERVDGAMTLRRAQALDSGERVLIVEDVVTTGGSAAEVLTIARAAHATVVGVACLVDRTTAQPPFRLHSLVRMEAKDWAPEDCPLCAAGIPITSPGSRFLASGGA